MTIARPASIAVGGFYATPIHLVADMARLVKVDPTSEYCVVDPCAAEGAAVYALAQAMGIDEDRRNNKVYTIELEESRYLKLRQHSGKAIHGDAFRVRWEFKPGYGAQVLYLNPPYHNGTLELQFLERFKDLLCEGGALFYVVPFSALAKSAALLATHFDQVSCFRFPDADFAAFKQVVLVARKRVNTLGYASPDVQAQIEAWSRDVSDMPILGSQKRPCITLRKYGEYRTGFETFELSALDLMGLRAKQRPWSYTDKSGKVQPIGGLFPADDSVLVRKYPMAMPPKPGHIAAGIAAGVFNGNRITPDDPASGLPDLLVKGVFDKEFRTVETKKNKDGETVGEIQVQQPKLVITALDMSTNRLHTIKASSDLTGTSSVAEMTAADLLKAYGRSLMAVMLQQCPVMHDPSRADHQIEIGPVARPLYKAQEQVAMGTVKLLGGVSAPSGRRYGKAAFVLGEIGSGKSSVALAVASTIKAKRVLVMCPPHLLDSWKEQAAAVLPWAQTRVLSNVSDVDDLAADQTTDMVIGILSREVAKLSHSWVGVENACPKCGGPVYGDPEERARTRARCEHTRRLPADKLGKVTRDMALAMMPVAPDHYVVNALFTGTHHDRLQAAYKERPHPWEHLRPRLIEFLGRAFPLLMKVDDRQKFISATMSLVLAIHDDEVTAQAARLFWSIGTSESSSYYGDDYKSAARVLLLFLKAPLREQLVDELKAIRDAKPSYSYGYGTPDAWTRWAAALGEIEQGLKPTTLYNSNLDVLDKKLHYLKHLPGTLAMAREALDQLSGLSSFVRTRPCGEYLFQAVPVPRRVPLANYIARRAPKLFDLLIQDEIHEYQAQTSAQGFAARQLTNLGIPTIGLTGSVMSGYAASLFANQWALDPHFREEFKRDQMADFVRRYGYLKQFVEDKDKESGKVVAYGSQSDRVETNARTVGSAPGVLPLFIMRYLLRMSVVLHKSDLAVDVPPRRDFADRIPMLPTQSSEFERLRSSLMGQIRKDQFTELSGKLWGQMAELPSYLDRATFDVGNTDAGTYEVRYPEAVGGDIVAIADPLDARILPKEEWMLARLEAELAEGRRVMILGWHTKLLPRLARLIEQRLGEAAPILDPNKVPAGKRMAWINKQIVEKRRRVMIVNPVAVQTGLNNLVWFSTQIWMENPAVNAVCFRQATGRIDRIGQTQETRIYFPVYEGVAQESLHKLLLHKVGVSMATDGLDADSALQAAGVGDAGEFTAMSVGKQLFEMLQAA